MVKVTDWHLANLGSTPTDIHMSHWWQHEEHPTKIAPTCMVGISEFSSKRESMLNSDIGY